jgi:protoheme IX farnesyltransferase
VTNIIAAALLAVTISFYVGVYTIWLKRLTPQNIVIGGAAGALPPMIGWAAATGRVDLEPIILFLIIFLWTPPHFWALSLNRVGEYTRAGIPMLPVIVGSARTKQQILAYTLLLVPVTMLPCFLGFTGVIYGATATLSGAVAILLAVRVWRGDDADRRSPKRLFAFSIVHLFLLFAVLMLDPAARRSPSLGAQPRVDALAVA